ncbi:MAG: hypothetical protein SFY67_02655 [Candidatus Melainabacteria bacterium]|nr:hypothetical protein [Candidatus Melainabacteria bacterium]
MTTYLKTGKIGNLALIALLALSQSLVQPVMAAGLSESDVESAGSASVLLAPHVQLQEGTVLKAGVEITDKKDENTTIIDELVNTAHLKHPRTETLDKKVKTHNSGHRKVIAKSFDALNYVFGYRGSTPSSEMGDVILEEKKKLKSKGSAEWLSQQHKDEVELAVVSTAMDLAAALGGSFSDAKEDKEQATIAYENLKELVGEDLARKTVAEFRAWSRRPLNVSALDGKVWSINQRQQKQKAIMQICKDTDPVIKDVVDAVHKYNGHGKLYLATARTIKTSLGIASMSPTVVAPASQIALFFYTMATGGDEEDKMLREIYLDKRLASRSTVISEKSHLALDRYQIAKLTKNPILMTYCENVVKHMTGSQAVSSILGPTTQAATASTNDVTTSLTPAPVPAPAPAPVVTDTASSDSLTIN